MKRIFQAICLFLFLGVKSLNAGHTLFEFKVGNYRPSSDVLKDIFSNGWVNYQLEFSYTPFEYPCTLPFEKCCEWWKNFYLWGSINYIYDEGITMPPSDQDDTCIQIIPYAIGLKYIQPLPWYFSIYGSAGMKYFLLKIDNDSEDVSRRERADGLGGVFSVGAIFTPYRCFTIDFFADYSHKHFREREFSEINNERGEGLDISGMTLGIGVGIWF